MILDILFWMFCLGWTFCYFGSLWVDRKVREFYQDRDSHEVL